MLFRSYIHTIAVAARAIGAVFNAVAAYDAAIHIVAPVAIMESGRAQVLDVVVVDFTFAVYR